MYFFAFEGDSITVVAVDDGTTLRKAYDFSASEFAVEDELHTVADLETLDHRLLNLGESSVRSPLQHHQLVAVPVGQVNRIDTVGGLDRLEVSTPSFHLQATRPRGFDGDVLGLTSGLRSSLHRCGEVDTVGADVEPEACEPPFTELAEFLIRLVSLALLVAALVHGCRADFLSASTSASSPVGVGFRGREIR